MELKKTLTILCLAALCAFMTAAAPSPVTHNNVKTVNHAFGPGEKLTYNISWSNIVDAGIAVMEVREGKTADNRPVYDLVSTTRSVGVVERFYPVRDTVESVVDAEGLYSLSFHLQESHGDRKREREMRFDHARGTVSNIVNNGAPETSPVPDSVQDALSSMYYVRTRKDFTVGSPMVVDVHDSGKNWAVEIHTIGKERITTPAGDFNTIKIKTYPKYEGVFMHKGEIFIWLTDDERKIPVLMKSKISIGSIMATLTGIQGGKISP